MTIVVTGATGTVGGPLVARLRESGASVRAVVRDEGGVPPDADPSVEWRAADLDAQKALVPVLDGADAVYVLVPAGEPMASRVRNVVGAATEAAHRPRVVLHAMAGVEAPGDAGRYPAAHAEGLAALRASGLPYTVLAPNAFYQNFLGMADAIKSGTLAVPAGDGAVSFIDTRDIADTAAHVLTAGGHDGEILTLTGPEAITHDAIAATFTQVTGREVRYQAVPPEEARTGMKAAGMDPWQVDGLIELYGAYATGAAAAVTDTVQTLLGRPPRPLEQFVRDHEDVFR